MELKERLAMAIESMDILSNRLGELSNLINTVHLGLMSEKAEKQTLDCMMCIRYSVKELQLFTEQALCEARTKTHTEN